MSQEVTIAVALYWLADLIESIHAKRVEAKRQKQQELQTQIQELKSQGYEVGEIQEVKDLKAGETLDCDLVVKTAEGDSIGLKRDKHGTYSVVGRWSAIQPFVQLASQELKQAENQIKQQYAYQKTKAEVKKQGFIIAKEEVLPDNSIKIVVRKW